MSSRMQAAVEFVEQDGKQAVVCRPWTFVWGIPVTVGGYREVCRGRVGYVAGGGFWWVERLNAEDNEGMYLTQQTDQAKNQPYA